MKENTNPDMYPDHGISAGTITVPSISAAVLMLRRTSLYTIKETQTIHCRNVYVYFFLHAKLIQPGQEMRK